MLVLLLLTLQGLGGETGGLSKTQCFQLLTDDCLVK